MRKRARQIDQLPEEILEAAAAEFKSYALKALEGLVFNQRELADRLGWPETTLSSALRGGLTFSSWPKICRAIGRDAVDELVRGRDELRRSEDRNREDAYRQMLERAEADTMLAFWKTLSPEEKNRLAQRLAEVTANLDLDST